MKRLLYILAACLSVGSLPASAQSLDGLADFQLLAGWRTDRGTQMGALRVTLRPGWKTYWRAPGDAGIPAQFDWSGSDNLGAVAVYWPVPQVFDLNGMTTVGYRDQVIIPIEFTPRRADHPISLQGMIDMGVCENVCVPISGKVAADLAIDTTHKDARIVAALKDRPMTAREAGVSAVQCAVATKGTGLHVTATVVMPPLGGDEFVVVELPGAPVWVSQAASQRRGESLAATVDILPDGGAPLLLDRSNLRITVLGQRGAVDIHGCG